MGLAALKRRMRSDDVVSSIFPRSAERIAQARADAVAKFGDDGGFLADVFPGALVVSTGEVTAKDLRAQAERRQPPSKPAWWTDDVRVTTGDWINANESRPEFHGYSHAYARKPHQWSDLGPRVWRTMLHRHGWTWYPQRQVDGQRKPAGATEKADKNDPSVGISPKWLAHEAATPARTENWVYILDKRRQRDVQVALPLGGAASMFMAAEDGDVDDPAIVERIDRVRALHMPETPYVRCRHGSVRTARLYRQDPADPWQINSIVFKVPEGVDAKAPAIEFLSTAGQSITILGRHYKTQDALQWRGLHPGLDEGATPFRAPVVSSAQVRAYHDALRAEFADELEPETTRSPRRGSGEVREYDGDVADLKGLRLPARPHYQGAYGYDAEGRVRTPRDPWLYQHCRYVAHLAPNLDAPPGALARLVELDLSQWLVTTDWPKADAAGGVYELIVEKMTRMVDLRDSRIATEGFRGYRVANVGGVEISASEDDYEADEYDRDPDIRALVPRRVGRKDENQRVRFKRMRGPANPERAASRALLDDRSDLTARVSDEIKAGLRRVLNVFAGAAGVLDAPRPQRDRLAARRAAAAVHDAEVRELTARRAALLAAGASPSDVEVADLLDRVRAAGMAATHASRAVMGVTMDWSDLARIVYVLKAPTGSGKTTMSLAEIRDLKARLALQGRRLGTILYFAPSHALLQEVSDKAAADPVDDDAVVVSEDEANAIVAQAAEARALGLKVKIYKGKNQVCTHPALATLTAGGISGQTMCHKKIKRQNSEGQWVPEDVNCPRYSDRSCVFWNQRDDLEGYDILFMPTAYLTLPIPEEVRAVAVGVIADESIASNFLAYAMMPLAALGVERTVPRVNKEDAAKGVDADLLLQGRRIVADVVREILLRGEDPAAGLLAWAATQPGDIALLNKLLSDAINVVGRAMAVHEEVSAHMTQEAARQLVELRSHPTMRWLSEERRFWVVVRERVGQLITDRALSGIASTPGLMALADAQRKARGDHDHRVQLLRHEGDVPTVRVSFRRKCSFADLPTLLMDASADLGQVKKIYSGRPVEEIRCECPPHLRVLAISDRTMSDTSLLPYKALMPFAAAESLCDIRTVIDGLAALFGYSQVGVASTLSLELAANTAWRMPSNATWLHYNNVVGFDALKNHPAMCVIGRQELPIHVIDALVGALTYDDAVPEEPIDKLGTGLDRNGVRVRAIAVERVHPMRDGSDVVLEDHTYAGEWARAVQAQAREEQVRQAIGRLRPVYRSGLAPLLVYIGRALPTDIIIDAMASLDDVVDSPACALGRDLRANGLTRYDGGIGGPSQPHGPVLLASSTADRSMQELRHHAQRGLATVEFELQDGQVLQGHVPMADMSDDEVTRRVDRYLSLCSPPRFRAPGSDVHVVKVPERDKQSIVRGDDPKMVARLGDRAARQVAEDEAATFADRVRRAAVQIQEAAEGAAAKAGKQKPSTPPQALATVATMAAVLTVRKRGPLDPANDLATLLNAEPHALVVPALARAAEPEDGARMATRASAEAAREEWRRLDAAARFVDESEPEIVQDNEVERLRAALDGDPAWDVAA